MLFMSHCVRMLQDPDVRSNAPFPLPTSPLPTSPLPIPPHTPTQAERAQRRAEKKALKQAFRNEEARQAKQLTANRMNKLSTVKY